MTGTTTPRLLRRFFENLPTQETTGYYVATTRGTSSLRSYPGNYWVLCRNDTGHFVAPLLPRKPLGTSSQRHWVLRRQTSAGEDSPLRKTTQP